MSSILIFMVISIFSYTLLLKHYHISKCPRCNSNNITIDRLIDHTQFTCKTCRFSYKDYYEFLFLTPITDQLDLDFSPYDDESDNDIDAP